MHRRSSDIQTTRKKVVALWREYVPYYRRNLAVAFPVMLTQLGAAIVGLADCIMVGHYSTTDLAAVSFANGVFFTFMVFSMGALMGITPLVGQAFVQRQDERVSSLLQNGLWFTLLLGGITTLLLAACVPLMPLMGQDPAVVEAARPYMIMRILSLLPFLLFILQKQFLEGVGNTIVAMLVCLVLNLVNILLNWVFIFGHWGAEPMGAYGAGLASLIATVLMPVAFIIAIACKRDWRHYLSLFSRKQNSRSILRELATVGFPIGLQTTMETGSARRHSPHIRSLTRWQILRSCSRSALVRLPRSAYRTSTAWETCTPCGWRLTPVFTSCC